MHGLKKMIEQIEQTGRLESEKILAEARDRSVFISEEFEERAEAAAKLQKVKAEQEQRLRTELLLSRVQTECEQQLLQKRRQLMAQCFQSAYQSFCNLPPEEYEAILTEMIIRKAVHDGELLLSQRDLKRINAKRLLAKVNSGLGAKSRLKLSKKTLEEEFGFLLEAGDVTENCTLSELFTVQWERLAVTLPALLFNEVLM